jgi:hypothetical protein
MIGVDRLHESATKITGLTDFGDGSYLDGLKVLVESYNTEAQLTGLGQKVMRAFLRGALVSRALSESAWQMFPEHAEVELIRPVFLLGLPRTGTTALHRLLTADPAHQGLELWLTEVPQPRPPRELWSENPVFAAIQAGYEQHHQQNPEFMGLHYISADQVEECWQLLRQSMRSVHFECLAHVPSYSQWLQGQDWTVAYRRHRRNLQLIGLPDTGQRWVLKNPSHMFALDALLAVYPDALIIQTHRDPVTAIASVCSLNAHASQGWSELYQGEVVGRDQLALWERGLSHFTESRQAHDPAQFVDVHYDDFVRDPLRTVEQIYDRLGEPLSVQAREAMLTMDQESRSGGRRPAHRYQLEEFGLSEKEVRQRLGEFYQHPSAGSKH